MPPAGTLPQAGDKGLVEVQFFEVAPDFEFGECAAFVGHRRRFYARPAVPRHVEREADVARPLYFTQIDRVMERVGHDSLVGLRPGEPVSYTHLTLPTKA